MTKLTSSCDFEIQFLKRRILFLSISDVFWCFWTHGYPIQKLIPFLLQPRGVCGSHSPFLSCDITKSYRCFISETVNAIDTFNPLLIKNFMAHLMGFPLFIKHNILKKLKNVQRNLRGFSAISINNLYD